MKLIKEFFYDELPYAGMIDDGIIITKEGFLVRTAEVHPRDLQFENGVMPVKLLQKSFGGLGDGWYVYLDIIRKKYRREDINFAYGTQLAQEFEKDRISNMKELYVNKIYNSHVYFNKDASFFTNLLLKDNGKNNIFQDLKYFKRITREQYNYYRSIYKDVIPLKSDDLLRYIHSTYANDHPIKTPPHGFFLDYILGSDINNFEKGPPVRINDEYIRMCSIIGFPSELTAGTISKLMCVPIEFRLSFRLEFYDKSTAKSILNRHRNFRFNKQKSLKDLFFEMVTKEKAPLKDTEAEEDTLETDAAIASLNDHGFGSFTSMIMVRSKSLSKADENIEKLKKIINETDLTCREEEFNIPLAFIDSLPGCIKHNPRHYPLSTDNFSYLFGLSNTYEGKYTNSHLQKITGNSHPHLFCKSYNSPYFLNLNYQDVGNTLVIGPIGSGKSILLQVLALNYYKYGDVQVFYLDIDKSSQYLCHNLGGVLYDVGDVDGISFNPFAAIDNSEHLRWLTDLIIAYVNQKGITTNARDEIEINSALKGMTKMKISDRNFATFQNLVQDEEVRAVFQPFIDGQYAHLFCSGDDSFDAGKLTVFELKKIVEMENKIKNFILSYIIKKISDNISVGGKPTCIIFDEGWKLFEDDNFLKFFKAALKTLRKYNVYIIFATQEVDDITESPIFTTILNSCKTKILLPNCDARLPKFETIYGQIGLLPNDIDILSELIPKRDYMFMSPEHKQVFDLCLGKRQLEILTRRIA